MRFKKLAAIASILFSCGISVFFVYCKGNTDLIPNGDVIAQQRRDATEFVAYTAVLANRITQYEDGLLGILALNNINIAGLRDVLLASYEKYVNFYTSQAIIGILTVTPVGVTNSAIENCGNAYLQQDVYKLPTYIQTAYNACLPASNGAYLSFDFSYPNAPFIFYSDANYTIRVACDIQYISVPTPSACLEIQNMASSQIGAFSKYGLP